MRTIQRLFLCLVLFTLSACISTGNPSVKNHSLTDQVIVGVTTKDDIRALLGTPTSTSHTITNGISQEMWQYSHIEITSSPLLWVPVVGLFVLASGDHTDVGSHDLTVFFSEDGVVKSLVKGTMQSGSGEPAPVRPDPQYY